MRLLHRNRLPNWTIYSPTFGSLFDLRALCFPDHSSHHSLPSFRSSIVHWSILNEPLHENLPKLRPMKPSFYLETKSGRKVCMLMLLSWLKGMKITRLERTEKVLDTRALAIMVRSSWKVSLSVSPNEPQFWKIANPQMSLSGLFVCHKRRTKSKLEGCPQPAIHFLCTLQISLFSHTA